MPTGPFDNDVIASAPTPAKGPFGGKTWMGNANYPLVHADHEDQLERDAAVHEFGSHMPREEAEKKAYDDYKAGQHKEAAAHHLAGQKAAEAIGDDEGARK